MQKLVYFISMNNNFISKQMNSGCYTDWHKIHTNLFVALTILSNAEASLTNLNTIYTHLCIDHYLLVTVMT